MKSNVLSLNRFQELADSYGGDIDRWPEADRADAWAIEAADPAAAQPILAEAARLDRWLAASPAPTPSRDLVERIVATAPRARGRSFGGRWAGAALGASLVAASIAGVLVGSVASYERQQTATAAEAARLLGEPSDLSPTNLPEA